MILTLTLGYTLAAAYIITAANTAGLTTLADE